MNSYIAGELRPYQGMKDSGVKWLGKIPSHWKVLPNLNAKIMLMNFGVLKTKRECE